MSPTSLPSNVVLNHQLTTASGQDVIKIEVVKVAVDDELRISFQNQNSEWRQGIWLGVDGELEVATTRADQIELWTDTAPSSVTVRVLESKDGLLRLYNIWDSGRGRRRESQSLTSGMLKQTVSANIAVYRCNDISSSPSYDRLIFQLERVATI